MFASLSSILRSDRATQTFLFVLLGITVVAALANLLFPPDSALHVSTYTLSLLGKYMTYALLAVAIDLIWGYCGILSLGHTAFFALGGYAMGMYLMRQIGTRGVYGDPVLPDFMVFLNWDALPWYWHGFDMFWFAMLMVVLAPGILAFVFGWLAFRSRVTGVYLSIITQALTYALMLAFFRNEMGFGGNNGLTDFKDIIGFDLQADSTRVALFVASAIALALGVIACRFIIGSRFGRVVQAIRDAESRTRFIGFDLQADSTRVALFVASAIALALGVIACRFIIGSRFGRVVQAIRDAESRTRFIGYRVDHYKLWLFVFSAMLAGIAGALYVPQVGIINSREFAPINAIERSEE